MPGDSTRHEAPLGAGAAVLACDIGGTDTKAALFDPAGRMLGLSRTATPLRGTDTADAVLDLVEHLAAGFARDFPDVHPTAVGLIAPGIVDDEQGIGIHSANLHWDNVPFKKLTEVRLNLPASFSHDVRAAGEAEHRLGAARPFRDAVVMVSGTGIAASIILGGRAHIAGGFAGEIGHSIIDPCGEVCACGAVGCLETVASAGAILRRYCLAGGRPAEPMPASAKQVLALAQTGDLEARRVWNDALDALALVIEQLASVLAPEAVVIGGGLSQAGDALFVPLRERVDALLSFHRRPLLLPARIGENAGLLGAALRARAAAERGATPPTMPTL
ncbi:ROK family protein [Cryobacterium sp. M23]|uniref:ROK family protein n=1 Tax=Cryobacterium sp. M23 TaxID=2048292 RepID=UPI000CE3F036|nr:ROK family protein [Cryobacterium sp. M23]